MSAAALRARVTERARGLPGRHGGRLVLGLVCAIVALGAGLRIYYAIATANPTPDSHGYALIAERLYTDQRFGDARDFAGNKGLEQPSNYSPGLPLFVAGGYYLSFGVHPLLARLLLALVAALAVPLAYLLGRRLRGPPAGAIAALCVAVYPILVQYSGMYMTEPLAVTLLAGAVLALLWAGEQERKLAWAVPGALLGATAMVRPEYLAVAGVFAVMALLRAGRDRGWASGAGTAAILLVAFLLPIIPWTVRNLISLDRFVPISTGGGKALFIGTYLPGDGTNDGAKAALIKQPVVTDYLGRAHPRHAPGHYDSVNLDEILSFVAGRRHPGKSTDSALTAMGRENISRYFSRDSGAYLGMFAGKAFDMWKGAAGGPGLAVMHERFWLAFHRVVVALGALGLALLAWRRRWEAVVLGAILLTVTLLGTILLPSPRRALIALPLVAALAGYAITSLTSLAATRGLGEDNA